MKWTRRLREWATYSYDRIDDEHGLTIMHVFTDDRRHEGFVITTDDCSRRQANQYADKLRRVGYDVEVVDGLARFRAFAQQCRDGVFLAALDVFRLTAPDGQEEDN